MIKTISTSLMILGMILVPAFAQDQPGSDDIVSRMKTDLDLQQEQVTNITPIIEKYSQAFADLQKSTEDNTINPSAVSSQKQGLEDQETQEISQYLKPDQLSRWRDLQGQLYQPKDGGSDDAADADQYSNMPHPAAAQN